MEWNKIKATFGTYVAKINPLVQKINPLVDTAKGYGKKVAKFAEDQVQITPLFIKTQAEYDAFLLEKRIVIIAYDDTNSVAQDIHLLSSVWITRSFMDAAKLKFISLAEPPEFVAQVGGFTGPVDMRVRFEGDETLQLTDIEAIKSWWQFPVYKKMAKDEKPYDPLRSL